MYYLIYLYILLKDIIFISLFLFLFQTSDEPTILVVSVVDFASVKIYEWHSYIHTYTNIVKGREREIKFSIPSEKKRFTD